MQNVACIQLRNNKSFLVDMVHVPQWNMVIALWNRSQLWGMHDQITKSGLHVVDTIDLNSNNHIAQLCVVNLRQRTEVWATRGEKEVVILQDSPTGFCCERTLTCTIDKNLLFCHFITCLHFSNSETGNCMIHVWVSFKGRPHLICWDAEKRVQIHSIFKKGKQTPV